MRNITSVPRVLIVGAGFGGLRAAQQLRGKPVQVTVLDRRNYHTFVPLLYQVATAGLEPEAIAQPIRRIVRAANVRFGMAEASGVDLERRAVLTGEGEFPYDYLVLAAGSVANFFGLESVARTALPLRDLDDAERVRDRVLGAFEEASAEREPQRRREWMTLVVVGGGPTGVETAGALAELRRHVLPKDYPELDIAAARILLLEAADRLLPGFPDGLQKAAAQKLRELGVDVRLNAAVAQSDDRGVTLRDGERIPAGAVIWVAGLKASPLGEALVTPRDRAGRVIVSEAMQLPGRPEVYVVGDMAHAGPADGAGHPMLAPVAIQQADLAAQNILRDIAGRAPKKFRYKDRGTMVTIGRQSAVARAFRLNFTGFPAWVLWLTVHLYWLIGFRNRLLVLVNWAWNYFTYDRGVRLIRRRPR